MKTHHILKVTLIAVAALSLAACGKSSDDRSSSRSAAGVLSIPATCPDGSSATGYVYDDSGYGFTENVRAFLSATMNPNDIGEVSGHPNASTGVDMRLRLAGTGGSVSAAGTKLNLIIYDSYVGQPSNVNPGQPIQPITIAMNAVSVESAGSAFIITFQDNAGTVLVRINNRRNNAFEGQIDFQNFTNVAGGSPASGTLGAFVTPSCGQ